MPFTRDELKAGEPNPTGRVRNRNRGIPTQGPEHYSTPKVIRTSVEDHSTSVDNFVKNRSAGIKLKGEHKA